MNLGPMGVIGSTAGSSLAQSQGTDVNRAQQDTSDQSRQAQLNDKAEKAAGVGETEQDAETSDRDADGRRPWEITRAVDPDDSVEQDGSSDETDRKSKDPSGQKGRRLDLSG